jgi:glycosyltransferase involved in cell wall biosynthesis
VVKVLHISFSRAGGAGRVAEELVRLQKAAGLQSELKYAIDSTISQEPFREPLITASAIFDRLATTDRESALFSMFRDSIVSVNQDDFAGLDVLHLHWTPGMLNAESIEKTFSFFPNLKIVWTLHDMFPFTGGCHHAKDCAGFESSCSNCPQIHPIFRQKVRLALNRKKSLVQRHPAVTFVSPSKWLANTAMNSSVIRGKKVEVIPNPIREEFIRSRLTQKEAREIAGFDLSALISFVIAEDLSDPNKDVQSFVNALPATLPDGTKLQIVLVGSKGGSISSTGADLVRLGKLTSAELATVLPAADLLAVPSKVENSPSTIWEAAAVGVPSLANNSNPGGQELVTTTGFGRAIDHYDDILENLQDLAGIRRNRSIEISRRARELADGDQVEAKYRDIYVRKV